MNKKFVLLIIIDLTTKFKKIMLLKIYLLKIYISELFKKKEKWINILI